MALIRRDFELKETRCLECGQFWAAEHVSYSAGCPNCAARKIAAAELTVQQLRRSNVQLRAALKKRQARR